MAKKIGVRVIIVVRQAKVDRLDDSSSPPVTEHSIEGCVVLPRASSGAQSSAEEGKGWVIVEGRMIVAPFGADILPDDQVKVDGQIWDVDGRPGDYENKRGRGKATIVYLKALGT